MSITRSTVESFLQRLGEGDPDRVAELFAASIDWFVPDSTRLPWTGVRTRRDDVAPYLRSMWSHFKPGQSEVRIDKILVDGEDAVVLGHFSHVIVSNDRQMATPVAMHLAVTDGEIVRMHIYEDTLAIAEAFAHPA